MRFSGFFSPLLFAVLLVGNAPVQGQGQDQRTACVEPSAAVANDWRAKRAATKADCSPEIAMEQARDQAREKARDAIAAKCIRRVSVAEARALCEARGMALPDPDIGVMMSEPPIARAGESEVDFALIIKSHFPKVCAVLRDIPHETETWTTPAGIENGGCILNNFRLTHKKARSRAFCAVQCMPLK